MSCTDGKCSWKKDYSEVLKNYSAAPLDQHECFGKEENNYLLSEEQNTEIKNIMIKNLPESAYVKEM